MSVVSCRQPIQSFDCVGGVIKTSSDNVTQLLLATSPEQVFAVTVSKRVMPPALRFLLGHRLLAISAGMFVAETNGMQYLQRIETGRCAPCVLAVFVGLLVPTPAAAHGGNADPNAIHACVQNVTKIARIVGVTGRCLTAPASLAETAVHWAIVGPIGPAGTPGTPGTNGTNGLMDHRAQRVVLGTE